jgi:hypothetical protein
VFTYEKQSWNTYAFRLLASENERVIYEWNFGDGVKSGKPAVTHTYKRSGEYSVVLKTTQENGAISQESVEITIPFFTLQNSVIRSAVVILALLFLLGLLAFIALRPSVFVPLLALWAKRVSASSKKITRIHIKEE